MAQHTFDSTSGAYDATQCDDTIRNGDILLVESERVVGLAATWPVAVTVEHGSLHTLRDGRHLQAQGPDLVGRAALERYAADHRWTPLQIVAAVVVAQEHGWPVAAVFLEYAVDHGGDAVPLK